MNKLYSLLALLLVFFGSVNAQVSGSDTVCTGDIFTYNVPVAGGGSYAWNITGGNILGAANVDSAFIQWGVPGVGTIVVTVTPVSGPPVFHTLNVVIRPKPDPLITHLPYPGCPVDTSRGGTAGQGDGPVCEKVCKGATIVYNTPLNALSTYSWVATGHSNIVGATTNSVTVTWDNTLTGSLVVYETNQWGCVDSSEICIQKVDLPVANFSHQASACRNTSVAFTNLSTGATSYQWFFGDGGTSNVPHPTHAYTTAGNYTITLIAENDCHCTDTFTSVINIDSLPGPIISCPATVCAGDTATYSTPSGAGCVYNWIVTGGTIVSGQGFPNLTVAWGPGQLGTLGLFITGCGGVCNDTTFITIPIVPTTATISGPQKVCAGSCETYTLPLFSGAGYTWSLGSGSGACGILQDTVCCNEVQICWNSNLFSCNDTLNVTYFDTFLNCGGSAQYIIRLRPRLNIFGQSPACANSTTNFNASAGVPCFWSVSPPGPTISGSPGPNIVVNWNGFAGNFVITAAPVNPNNVCNDTATFPIKVVAPPVAPVITGDTIICPGSSVSYCAVSASIVNWLIVGGTPVNGVGNCITVLWNNTGPYSVSAFNQMAMTPHCNSDTTLQNVYPASPAPPVIIGPTPACANSTTTYYTPTLYPAGTTFTWSLNPPNAGAVLSPGTSSTGVQWGNNAPQNVWVVLAVNACGTILKDSILVALNPIPNPVVAQIGSLCAGGTAQLFTTTAYTGYNWSGPGAFTSGASAPTISLNGLYQVTVTDGNGCTASAPYNVTYVSGPTASISTFDPTVYCIGSVYSANLCALGNANYNYAWSNAALTQCTAVSTPGSYSVVVTDITNGCTATSNVITISEITCGGGTGTCTPNGSISFTHSGCNPVNFTNTSVSGSSYSWNFGDLTTSGATSPTHTYAQAGFYLVTLSGNVPAVPGPGFCLLQDTAHIEIPLAAKFDFVAGCNGTPVCFTDKSTFTAGNSITSWSWNFGDASLPDNTQNPCHTYAGPGTYTVVLTISNGTCSTTYTLNVTIANPPVAAFSSSNPNCINQPVSFTDLSTGAVNYWNWNFGDAGTSLNQNPFHTYAIANTYPVTLVVRDIYGCRDTVVNPIVISAPTLTGNITAYPDTVVCSGTSVLLVAPTCVGCTYLWNTGSTNDSITINTTGIYTVTLTDANGCPYTTFIRIIVNNGPPAIIQNNGSDELCLGEYTYLFATYNANYTYSWITNDGVNNGATANTIFVMPAVTGVYTYELAITDTITGCSDTSLPYVITVHPNPVPPVITPLGPTTVCHGDTIILVASHPDPTVTLQWNDGSVNDTLIVTEDGCYQVQVTDTNGCTNKARLCVTVNPLPDLCTYYEGCFDTCKPYTIYAPSGSSYQWLFNGNPIPPAAGVQPSYTATISGSYSVIVTNAFGCVDTTGELNLNLYDCPDSLCADLEVDSIYCDSAGNHVMVYHVVNNSQIMLTQVNLEILQPNLNVPYSPNVVYQNIPSGGSSTPLTAVILGVDSGDVLCFRAHISAFDSLGHEELCCYSDTVCVTVPPCPNDTCCYFNLLSDTVVCEQTPIGTKYNFSLQIDGCGQLVIQGPNNGGFTANNPYNLTPGSNTVNFSYIANGPADTILCLTFMVSQNGVYCKDTTICFTLSCKQHPMPCNWSFKKDVCVGGVLTFNYYGPIPGNTFNWTFTGGTPATATGPGPHVVTYTTAGTFPVSMTITNTNGITTCRDSVTVHGPPIAVATQTGNTLTVTPAGMNYQWYTGQPGASPVAGATNQFFTPAITGFYCVVVTSPYSCADTACIDHQHVGINEMPGENWNIFPNPNQGTFTLSVTAAKDDDVEMKVMNALGEVVDLRHFNVHTGVQQFQVSNSHFAAGIYIIQLKTENGISLKRMMVK